MPVVPALATTVPAATPFYRITALSYRTRNRALHRNVVNGMGAVKSRHGARYNHPGALAVYLAEDFPTCLAERMFYFHREVLLAMDSLHITGVMPPFQQKVVLWEVRFHAPIPDVFELNLRNAAAAGAFPSLMLNPSQDYHHLKDGRAAIQNQGYDGLRAPSSRVVGLGRIVVLFSDQSGNVATITPFDVEFRLVTAGAIPAVPFANHATDLLDFTAGEVFLTPHRVLGAPGSPPGGAGMFPAGVWTRVPFHH